MYTFETRYAEKEKKNLKFTSFNTSVSFVSSVDINCKIVLPSLLKCVFYGRIEIICQQKHFHIMLPAAFWQCLIQNIHHTFMSKQ